VIEEKVQESHGNSVLSDSVDSVNTKVTCRY